MLEIYSITCKIILDGSIFLIRYVGNFNYSTYFNVAAVLFNVTTGVSILLLFYWRVVIQ